MPPKKYTITGGQPELLPGERLTTGMCTPCKDAGLKQVSRLRLPWPSRLADQLQCDKKKPTCSPCSQNGTQCTYALVPPKGPQKRGPAGDDGPPKKKARTNRRRKPDDDDSNVEDESEPEDDEPGDQDKVDRSLTPIKDIPEMFTDMVGKARDIEKDLFKLPTVIRIATVCSGTEAPLYATGIIAEDVRNQGLEDFQVQHMFGCEIEGFKQSFINRNHNSPLIFRNVINIGKTGAKEA
jgi:hypothetical protein